MMIRRCSRVLSWPRASMMVVMLLVLVQQSMQLRSNHPMHDVVDSINHNGGPYIGLVLAFPAEEIPLKSSGLFKPNPKFPYVQLSGRKFNIGKIRGVDVIYVMTGEQTANAALTVEVLLQAFDVKGIVHYGIAGSTNSSLTVGDVSVLNYVAFTTSWIWKDFGSETSSNPQDLKIGAYNLPQGGENSLAEIEFQPVQLFSNGQAMQEQIWFPVDPHWFNIATQIKGVHLQRCLNETVCLPKAPKIAFGLRGSTANVFLSNKAYANFLYTQYNISTADEESAAVLLTSITNGVPCIIFRGVSDVAGGDKLSLLGLSSLAAINSFRVAVKFLELIAKKTATL